MQFKKAIKWLDDHFEEVVIGALLSLMSCVMMLQIIMRYAFHSSLPWPEELSRYCFVVMGFMGIPYCMQKGKTLKVELLVSLMPKGVQKVMNLVSSILEISLYIFLFFSSFDPLQHMISSGEVTPAMQFPVYIVYLLVTVSFALGALRGVESLVRSFVHRKQEVGSK